MDGGTRRNTCGGRLGYPPRLSHPRVAASHHAVPDIIQQQWTNLRRSINGARVRERPLNRISFHSIPSGNCTARRPGVKHRGTVAGRYQAVPNLALSWRFIGIGRGGLHRRIDQWLNCRTGFRPAQGCVVSLRNIHLGRWRFWQGGPSIARFTAHRCRHTACGGRHCLGVTRIIGCHCAAEKRERCDKQSSPQGLDPGSRHSHRQLHSLYCTRGQGVTGPLVMLSLVLPQEDSCSFPKMRHGRPRRCSPTKASKVLL